MGVAKKPLWPPRPCVMSLCVEEPTLVCSLKDALEHDDDHTGALNYLFVNAKGMRGVWLVPHPDRKHYQ